MLNALIKFSLQNRLLVVASAAMLLVYGVLTIINLPVDDRMFEQRPPKSCGAPAGFAEQHQSYESIAKSTVRGRQPGRRFQNRRVREY